MSEQPTAASIRQAIGQALPCEHIRVEGDGHHFEALIVSAAFEGRSRVERHRLVYAALGDRMRQEIHALSMRTLAPREFDAGAASRPARARS